jgi:tRNA threonylcarbamoyl adenosine modification protein YjeE
MTAAPAAIRLTIALNDEAATQNLAMQIASTLKPGDVIALTGELGAGKTAFARALIRLLARDFTLDVPSPSFTLMQVYELPRFPVAHVDLYRLSDESELVELGLDEWRDRALLLIEWPDRAPDFLPPDRLEVAFALSPLRGVTYRDVTITGHGSFVARVERMQTVRAFIVEAGFAGALRLPLAGDASARAYERLVFEDRSTILMNAPRRPDGPPVRDGKPYSALVHLAEDITSFVALAGALRARGFSAPEIHAADLAEGLIILEDLGEEGIVSGAPPAPIAERYGAAVELLAELHELDLPDTLPVAPHVEYRLPAYDLDVFLIEVELLLDWYLPHMNLQASADMRAEFVELWREALAPALAGPTTWVLRDYHSPNLLWLPSRQDTARIGLLDFQDALIGPQAYDVASLLQDARVDVPEELEMELLGRYVGLRRAADANFDAAGFARIYAAVAAQRASRILGTFARLNRRDRKPQYLAHMPRLWRYLGQSRAHPDLQVLDAWYSRNLPPPN